MNFSLLKNSNYSISQGSMCLLSSNVFQMATKMLKY